jgi:hypothetical protein
MVVLFLFRRRSSGFGRGTLCIVSEFQVPGEEATASLAGSLLAAFSWCPLVYPIINYVGLSSTGSWGFLVFPPSLVMQHFKVEDKVAVLEDVWLKWPNTTSVKVFHGGSDDCSSSTCFIKQSVDSWLIWNCERVPPGWARIHSSQVWLKHVARGLKN